LLFGGMPRPRAESPEARQAAVADGTVLLLSKAWACLLTARFLEGALLCAVLCGLAAFFAALALLGAANRRRLARFPTP
jgi:hypothetical protein